MHLQTSLIFTCSSSPLDPTACFMMQRNCGVENKSVSVVLRIWLSDQVGLQSLRLGQQLILVFRMIS